MVYQIPYIPYPEGLIVNQMGSYDQAAGYVNSTSLRWSYGSMKGRKDDLILRQLSEQSLETQVRAAQEMGFSGIWVDRRGYADHGATIEAKLQGILGEPPTLISPTENQSFFVLSASHK